MKNQKRKYTVEENVFKTKTIFICGYSHEELGSFLKSKGVVGFDPDDYKDSIGTVQFYKLEPSGDEAFRLVWSRYFDKTPETIGNLAHEIFHLVVRICAWKGVPIEGQDNPDETGAYLADFYMRHFINQLYKK